MSLWREREREKKRFCLQFIISDKWAAAYLSVIPTSCTVEGLFCLSVCFYHQTLVINRIPLRNFPLNVSEALKKMKTKSHPPPNFTAAQLLPSPHCAAVNMKKTILQLNG